MPVYALGFDLSVDDDIRKNYNPSKLEQDMILPALPKNLQEEAPNSIEAKQYSGQLLQPAYNKPIKGSSSVSVNGNYAIIKKGTKFRTTLLSSLSDHSNKGTRVKFKLRLPVSTTYLTIPTGTVFIGELEDRHPPQLLGNGGLIKVRIVGMILNGQTYRIDGFVTQANYENIFFNNYKGKRRFASSMVNKMRPGYNFYKRMASTTARLLNDGWGAVWAPFPAALGIVGLAGNVAVAPVLATFTKGAGAYLRSGSYIEFKLAQDIIIYN